MKKRLLWISFILLLGVNIGLFYFLLSKKSYVTEVLVAKLRGGGMDWNIAMQVIGEDCKARQEDALLTDEGEIIDEEIFFKHNQYLRKILTYLGIETEDQKGGGLGFQFVSLIDNFIALPVANNCWVVVVEVNEQVVMGYEKKNGKIVKLLLKDLSFELLEEL